MKKKIARRWVKALRSGEYRQGQQRLRPSYNTFCCLGILCNIHAYDHPEFAAKQKEQSAYDGASGMPPTIVRRWAKIGDAALSKLAAMNDQQHATFDQIADYIEANRKSL